MTREVLDAKISFRFDNFKFNLIRINHSVITLDYPEHKHGKNFYEMHYIDGGEGTLLCEKEEFPLEKGSLVMTGPLVTHVQITNVDHPMSEYCFEFELSEVENAKQTQESGLLQSTVFWVGKDRQDMLSKVSAFRDRKCKQKIRVYSHGNLYFK